MNDYLLRRVNLLGETYSGFSKADAIIPISYTVSASLGSGNDMELKLYYEDAKGVNLGNIIDVGAAEFLSIIRSKEIDRKNKIITFRGSSLLGALNGCPTEFGAENGGSIRNMWFFNPSSASFRNHYNSDSTSDPHYNFAVFCNFISNRWGLPILFSESEYQTEDWFIENATSGTGNYYTTLDIGKRMFFDVISEFCLKNDKKPIIRGTSSGYEIDFKNASEVTHFLTDEQAIFSEEIGETINVDWNRPWIYYLDLFVTNNVTSSRADDFRPGSQLYPGYGMNGAYVEGKSYEEAFNEFKEKVKQRKIKTEFTASADKFAGEIGDYVTLVDAELGIHSERSRIIEKVLTMEGTSQKITFNIGG